ncbi:DUF6294 family protein [Kitasatospora sp. NPDC101447]|uniref:DUF6294 family protein n=1 Tax=Kitasatospora sp. NPDC101447 TaxID=3364102 RepID=UPI003803D54F
MTEGILKPKETINSPADGIALSDTVREVEFPVLQHIEFDFQGPFFAGHCELGAATFLIFSDGTCQWRANNVMSTAGDDSWLATFALFDRNGHQLHIFPRISSPSLSPPGHVVTWIDNHLTFPAFVFPFASRMTMQYHC